MKNPCRTCGTVEIPLTNGGVALVDAADAERVLQHNWWQTRETGGSYAARSLPRNGGRSRRERLHTFLTGWPLVDHINGNRLDNRRENLREADHSRNAMNRGPQANNTSGYKGVHPLRRTGRYQAQIQANGRRRHLGYFATPEEAARAYDRAAIEMHGEFARLNFPEEA